MTDKERNGIKMNFIKKRERKSRKSILFYEYLPRTEFFKKFIFFGQTLFTRMFGCFSVKKIIANNEKL